MNLIKFDRKGTDRYSDSARISGVLDAMNAIHFPINAVVSLLRLRHPLCQTDTPHPCGTETGTASPSSLDTISAHCKEPVTSGNAWSQQRKNLIADRLVGSDSSYILSLTTGVTIAVLICLGLYHCATPAAPTATLMGHERTIEARLTTST